MTLNVTADKQTLRVTEIFCSLQGESVSVGIPTVFIRLTGCPQRCQYCDTEYAFSGGEQLSFSEIYDQVARHRVRHITVTGGEPLAQPECRDLMTRLCDDGYIVSLETGGSIDIAGIDNRVSVVMDIKTPASYEEHNNLYDNIDKLQSKDQIKFVICNRADYDWTKDMIKKYDLTSRCPVLLSPSWQQQDATDLAEWIVQDALAVRLQIQLHKILWGEQRAR